MVRAWIQMGHCYRRTGSTGTTGEQAYVSKVAEDAAQLVTGHHGVKIALADEPIRGDWDLFIALHCDGSLSPSASGASVGYRTSASAEAARLWKRRFDARGWPYGFRDDNYTSALRFYYGTGWAFQAGITRSFVLEHGFLTNHDEDARWLRSDEGRRASALALADVIQIVGGGKPVGGNEQEDDDMFCRHGDTGDKVKLLQIRLNFLGADLKVDGIFGDATAEGLAARTSGKGRNYGPHEYHRVDVLVAEKAAA